MQRKTQFVSHFKGLPVLVLLLTLEGFGFLEALKKKKNLQALWQICEVSKGKMLLSVAMLVLFYPFKIIRNASRAVGMLRLDKPAPEKKYGEN